MKSTPTTSDGMTLQMADGTVLDSSAVQIADGSDLKVLSLVIFRTPQRTNILKLHSFLERPS